MVRLPITLGAVVGFAEHLAVLGVGCAAFAPGCHVVGVHVGKFPEFGLVGVVTEGAEWTVRFAFLFGFGGLGCVDAFLGGVVEDAHIQ